jgi:peptide/nickel transport system ATP-binding protein
MNAPRSASESALLEVRDLDVDFRLPGGRLGRRRSLRAVSGVSFDIGVGETLGLVGESGSGKTTIGRAILGLVRPSAGSVRFDGTQLVGLSGSRRRRFSTDMQVVFQNPYASLNPAISVGDAIAEPLRVHRGLRGADLDAEVAALLRRVGLDPASANRFPHAFSGGQRQRIAIARAIALRPRFVVYDEAVSALDVSTRGQIINLLAALRRDMGLASLFIGHDLAVVRHISDRIAVLYRGRVVEIGPADEITDEPRHPFTKRLVQSMLVADPRVQAARRGQQLRRSLLTVVPGIGCAYHEECPDRLPICGVQSPSLRRVGDRSVACLLSSSSPRPMSFDGVYQPRIGRRGEVVACIEVGGSSIQTIVFDGDRVDYMDGVTVPLGAQIAIAVPGAIRAGRVWGSSLGWRDADPAAMLGIRRAPAVVCNDAEAAALGEWVLRDRPGEGLVFVGLGTGVGGAVVQGDGAVRSNLFGHQTGFSNQRCLCGETGCLETVASGWALPSLLEAATLNGIAAAVAAAGEREPTAPGTTMLVASGGLVDSYPQLVDLLGRALPLRRVVRSCRPAEAKSAAAWGLRHLVGDQGRTGQLEPGTSSGSATASPPESADR